jgi:hypothetical protein
VDFSPCSNLPDAMGFHVLLRHVVYKQRSRRITEWIEVLEAEICRKVVRGFHPSTYSSRTTLIRTGRCTPELLQKRFPAFGAPPGSPPVRTSMNPFGFR